MKTFNLWKFKSILFLSIVAVAALQSCSTESDPIPDKVQNTLTDAHLRKTGLYPENSANAYDAAGQLMYDICHNYLEQGNVVSTTGSTISQVESIANLNSEYLTLRPLSYISPASSRIDYIMTNQQATALDIISNSSLSLKAKLSLTEFLTGLMNHRDLGTDFDIVYSYIINYETAVIGDNGYTANDRKIVLTATSVSRYGFYFAKKHRRKPRDRDWEISWGHIVAGMDGAADDAAKAIVMSAVCNLIANK